MTESTFPFAEPEVGQSTVVSHGQLVVPRPFVNLAKILFAALAVVLVSALAVGAIAVWGLAASIKPGVDLVGHGDVPPPPMIGALPGEISILLVGSDSAEGDPRYGERGQRLNDVTMLLHVPEDHSRATVVSFPRDTFVSIPKCPNPDGGSFGARDSQKLNTTLSFGGLPCTVLTIETLTGLSIPYAAVIEFQGVIAMSDAVGGVPVCVAEKIIDIRQPFPFILEPGEHVLKGAEALAFLRTRYALQTGSDLARSSSQRVFLSSLFRKIRSQDVLENPLTVYKLAQAALDNLTFSKSLGNVPTMASIAMALKDIPPERMLLVQYPTVEVTGGLIPNTDDADELFAALTSDQPLVLSGGTGLGAEPAPDSPDGPDDSPADSPSPSPPPPLSAASPPPSDPRVLPRSVVGQTAAQQTCSIGRPLTDQPGRDQ